MAQATPSPATPSAGGAPTVVLVHGAFADASGWAGVITRLQAVDFILQSLEAMRGGEVFIPLLQGFQVYDLMRALYPERAIKHVGLRSGGEKLHERLVSDEEWGRLYQTQWGTMILPSFNTWGAPGAWAEHPLMLRSNEFRFHSDRAVRLTVEQLGEICREAIRS